MTSNLCVSHINNNHSSTPCVFDLTGPTDKKHDVKLQCAFQNNGANSSTAHTFHVTINDSEGYIGSSSPQIFSNPAMRQRLIKSGISPDYLCMEIPLGISHLSFTLENALFSNMRGKARISISHGDLPSNITITDAKLVTTPTAGLPSIQYFKDEVGGGDINLSSGHRSFPIKLDFLPKDVKSFFMAVNVEGRAVAVSSPTADGQILFDRDEKEVGIEQYRVLGPNLIPHYEVPLNGKIPSWLYLIPGQGFAGERCNVKLYATRLPVTPNHNWLADLTKTQ